MFCHFVFLLGLYVLRKIIGYPQQSKVRLLIYPLPGYQYLYNFSSVIEKPTVFAREFYLTLNLISGLVCHLQLSFRVKTYAALF